MGLWIGPGSLWIGLGLLWVRLGLLWEGWVCFGYALAVLGLLCVRWVVNCAGWDGLRRETTNRSWFVATVLEKLRFCPIL